VVPPFVSVVVPFYNERRYLGRCIQAILAQDYPPDHYEIILVDDGSEDESGEIARRQVDARRDTLPRMTYARLRHCGLAAARNAGLSLAQGDVVAYVDGDALAEPGWLTGLVTTFGDDPRVGIVGGKINALNDEVTFAEFIHWIHYFWPDRARGERILVVGTNMAFRRAVFERVGGFFTNFWQRGDETSFLLKAERFFTARTTAEAVVRHERPDKLSRWLRERYYNGYFYAAELYILRQIKASPAIIRAHHVRYLLLAHNACLPVWMGLLAVWPAWPICLIVVLSWMTFGTFLWSRRRIGQRLKVLGRRYGLCKAAILVPYAVGLIALGEYLRAVGCIAGLWHFRRQFFDDDLQAAGTPIEYTHTNVVNAEP
jgi:cellulose synthase/poly-beta-1,6-N-acetylglucosamine synthase-like glycosyltransferase